MKTLAPELMELLNQAIDNKVLHQRNKTVLVKMLKAAYLLGGSQALREALSEIRSTMWVAKEAPERELEL